MSREWIAEHPGKGQWFEVAPPRLEILPFRAKEGAIDEIDRRLRTLDPLTRAQYEEEIQGNHTAQFGPDYLVRIEEGRVVGGTVAVVTPDNRNLTDLGALRFSEREIHGTWNYRGGLPRPTKVPGTLGVLSHSVCGLNFYHFLVECVPKLRQFEVAGIEVDRFYAPYRASYARQIFRLLGIPAERVVPEGAAKHLVADQLCVPSPIGFPRREAMRYLFQRMARQPWAKVGEQRPRRLYISRAKAGWRKVVNEREVMRMLARFGFEHHCLEDLSVIQQIELFQQAEVIIGPHGAGLANVVFSPPGALVIEIGTVVRPFGYFHRLCMQCDHTSVWFVGRAVQEHKRESHIAVDLRQFEACLARYLPTAHAPLVPQIVASGGTV